MTEPAFFFGTTSSPASAAALDDVQFLQAVAWNSNAPKPLVQAAKKADATRAAEIISRRRGTLRDGGVPKRIQSAGIGKPVLWSKASFEPSARAAELIALWESFGTKLQRPKGKRAAAGYLAAKDNNKNGKSSVPKNWFEGEAALTDWLSHITPEAPLQPFELLVLLEMLPTIGRELSPSVCWSLMRCALTGGIALTAESEPPEGSSAPDDQRVILGGELPFLLGVLFAGVKGAARLRRRGRKYLKQELLDNTDTDGTPKAELLERLPLWLAAFVRARQWASVFKERLWDAETEERFVALVRAVTSLCRTDGRLALGNGVSTDALSILTTAAMSSGFRRKSRPMRLLNDVAAISKSPPKSKRKGPKVPRLLHKKTSKTAARRSAYGWPVAQSDWARVACLRSEWTPDADVIAVAHDGALPRLDISASGTPLIEGDWEVQLQLDGRDVDLRGEWDASCWFSDRDVDFIELQSKSDCGLLIDRQIILSRTSDFACLIDCIHGADGRIDYRSRLTPVKDAVTKADTDTRELCIRAGSVSSRVYPLSLPCDRIDGVSGQLNVTDDGAIELMQSSQGGLVAPLLFDWSRKRRKAQADWQRLTVAEDGEYVGFEAAGGFHIRVGDLNLVVYRGLKATTMGRTLLGHHTRNETILGRFTAKGNVDELLMVE